MWGKIESRVGGKIKSMDSGCVIALMLWWSRFTSFHFLTFLPTHPYHRRSCNRAFLGPLSELFAADFWEVHEQEEEAVDEEHE